jgi:hypothetical protein
VITPEEAVRAYHSVLEKLGVKPHRSLEDDMQLQTGVMSYGGGGSQAAVPATVKAEKNSVKSNDNRKTLASSQPLKPDFAKMTPAERLAYHQERLKRTFGG